MAEQEPMLANPPTQDASVHVRDYTRFIKMMKWGAIISFLIALFVLIFVLK